jgi:hypothetical protein
MRVKGAPGVSPGFPIFNSIQRIAHLFSTVASDGKWNFGLTGLEAVAAPKKRDFTPKPPAQCRPSGEVSSATLDLSRSTRDVSR